MIPQNIKDYIENRGYGLEIGSIYSGPNEGLFQADIANGGCPIFSDMKPTVEEAILDLSREIEETEKDPSRIESRRSEFVGCYIVWHS